MNKEYQEAIDKVMNTFNCSFEEAEQAIEESMKIMYRSNAEKAGNALKEMFSKIK